MNSGTPTSDFARLPVRLVCQGKTLTGPVAFFEWLFGRSVAKAALASILVRIDAAGRDAFAAAVEHAEPGTAVEDMPVIVTGAGGDIKHFRLRMEAGAAPRHERCVILAEHSFDEEGRQLEARGRALLVADTLALTVSHDLGNLITLLKIGHELALEGEAPEIWSAAMSKLLLLADTLALGFGRSGGVVRDDGDVTVAVERAARLLEASFDVTVRVVPAAAGRLPCCATAQEQLDTAVYLGLLAAVRAAGAHGVVEAQLQIDGEGLARAAGVRITAQAEGPVALPLSDLYRAAEGAAGGLYRFGVAEALAITAKGGGHGGIDGAGEALTLAWPCSDELGMPDVRGGRPDVIVAGTADVTRAVAERIQSQCERIETYGSLAEALRHVREGRADALWFAEIRPDWAQPETGAALAQAHRDGLPLVALARSPGHEAYARVLCPGVQVLRWPCAAGELEQVIQESGAAR